MMFILKIFPNLCNFRSWCQANRYTDIAIDILVVGNSANSNRRKNVFIFILLGNVKHNRSQNGSKYLHRPYYRCFHSDSFLPFAYSGGTSHCLASWEMAKKVDCCEIFDPTASETRWIIQGVRPTFIPTPCSSWISHFSLFAEFLFNCFWIVSQPFLGKH